MQGFTGRGRAQQGMPFLGLGPGTVTPLTATQAPGLCYKHFIYVITVGKFPAKCRYERGIPGLMQEPVGYMGLNIRPGREHQVSMSDAARDRSRGG